MIYKGFCISNPNHPWGTLNAPAFYPYTSTPLGQAPTKLSQSPAQIRRPFWASSSRLGVSAPALSALNVSAPEMLYFSLWTLASCIQAQMALVVTYLRQFIALLLVPPLPPPRKRNPRWPRPWLPPPSQGEFTLAIFCFYSGSFLLAPKWL